MAACQGALVDDYCWLPEEFPEEVFFLGEEEGNKENGMVSLPRGGGAVAAAAAADRLRGIRGTCPLPSRPLSPSFPTEFPYDIDSSLSPSPLGSAAGTDSDDEEYEDLVAGLAEKMMASRSFRLSEVEEAGGVWAPSAFAGGEPNKISAGMRQYSPQSTLSPTGSWTALGGGGRSPTDTDYLLLASRKRDDSALDLLSAAALEVERMRIREGAELRRALAGDVRGLLPGPGTTYRKNSTATPHVASLNRQAAAASSGFYTNPTAHTHQHQHQPLQSTAQPHLHLHRAVPTPPAAAWGVGPRPNRPSSTPCSGFASAGGNRFPGTRPPLGSTSPYACSPPTWSLPPHQQQQQPLGGSGMRAVFLGGSGARRESSGTGVFLPRRDGNPPASKKKSGCSTVLLPARVVQALNLNLDEIGALPVSHGAGFVLNSEVIRARNRTIQAQLLQQQQQQQQQRIQNQNNAAAAAAATAATIHRYPNRQSNHNHHHNLLSTAANIKPAPAITQEIRLPPEWSY